MEDNRGTELGSGAPGQPYRPSLTPAQVKQGNNLWWIVGGLVAVAALAIWYFAS